MLLVAIPILLLVAVIATGALSAQRINENLDHLFNDRMNPISQIKIVSDSYAVVMVDTLHKYRAGLLDNEQVHRSFDSALSRGDKAWSDYRATQLTEEEMKIVDHVDGALLSVRSLVATFLEDVDSGNLRFLDSRNFNATMYSAFDPLGTQLSNLIDLQLKEGKTIYEESTAQYNKVVKLFWVVGLISILGMLTIAIAISLSINRPLSKLRSIIKRVQESSNLTLRADVIGRDEISETSLAFNILMEHQQSLILDLSATAMHLSSSSEEMSAISV